MGGKQMKLKANSILNIYNALGILADKELDLDTACLIAKNIKELEISKTVIDQKRDAVITEYAEKDENGNFVSDDDKGSIKISDIEEFSKKMDELLNTEITVNIDRISKETIRNIKISPKEVLPLMDILTD